MKLLSFKTIFLGYFFLFLLSFNGYAEKHTKNLSQKYDFNKYTNLVIRNKYGNIDIKNWNKKEILIEVEITVEASSSGKAEELLEYIDVNFSQVDNEARAETEIKDKVNKGWFNWDSKRKFSINYKVYMPSNTNIELVNKYGDVFVNELFGHVDIAVKYGTLRANKIIREKKSLYSKITLVYASQSAFIGECKWLNINVKYSSLEVGKAQALLILSKYSSLEIGEVSSIVCESKYDKYKIGNINNISIDAGYTNFKINQVSKKIEFDGGYSDCKVRYVPIDFEKILIESKYGNIRIGIDSNASYDIDAEANYAKVSVGGKTDRLNTVVESTEMRLEGTVGAKYNPMGKVKIYTKYGNVNLRE